MLSWFYARHCWLRPTRKVFAIKHFCSLAAFLFGSNGVIYFGWSFQRYFAPERQLCPQSKERSYLPERRCKANQRHLKGASTSLKDNLFVRTPPILVAPMQITDVNSLDECPLLHFVLKLKSWMLWFWALRSWERGLTPPLLVFASLYLPHSAWVAVGQNRSNTCFTDWDHPRPLQCCFCKMSLP